MTDYPDFREGVPDLPHQTMRGLAGEKVWTEFLRQSYQRWHPPGDILLRQGEGGTHVLAVLSGLAKVERTERNGSVAVLAFRGPGELLGELAVMGWGGRLASVTTLTRCDVAVMHEAAFVKFIQDYDLLPVLARFAQGRQRESTPQGGDLLLRLAATLVHVADLLVRSGSNPHQTLELPLKRVELARFFGVSRNTVTNRLGDLAPYRVRVSRMCILIEDLATLRRAVALLAG